MSIINKCYTYMSSIYSYTDVEEIPIRNHQDSIMESITDCKTEVSDLNNLIIDDYTQDTYESVEYITYDNQVLQNISNNKCCTTSRYNLKCTNIDYDELQQTLSETDKHLILVLPTGVNNANIIYFTGNMLNLKFEYWHTIFKSNYSKCFYPDSSMVPVPIVYDNLIIIHHIYYDLYK